MWSILASVSTDVLVAVSNTIEPSTRPYTDSILARLRMVRWRSQPSLVYQDRRCIRRLCLRISSRWWTTVQSLYGRRVLRSCRGCTQFYRLDICKYWFGQQQSSCRHISGWCAVWPEQPTPVLPSKQAIQEKGDGSKGIPRQTKSSPSPCSQSRSALGLLFILGIPP